MSSSFQLCLVQVTLSSASSKACWVTVLLFLENKLKGLSYVALPRLFPSLIISGLAPMELGLDILRGGRVGGGAGAEKHFTKQEN